MIRYLLVLSLILVLASCGEEVTMPKPRDYFRIDLPEKSYQVYESDCPYSFEYPVYSRIENIAESGGEKCRANIDFGKLHAKIHLTYKDLNNNVGTYLEDSRKLSYKHAVKASAIDEYVISAPQRNVYGLIYEVGGNTASAIQFHVTDSTKHFLRGSLYFYASPNADSLAPVVSFLTKDIEHLIETFEWKAK